MALVLHQPPLQPGPLWTFEAYPGKERLTMLVYHDTPEISFYEAQSKPKEALLQVLQDLESSLVPVG